MRHIHIIAFFEACVNTVMRICEYNKTKTAALGAAVLLFSKLTQALRST